MAMRIKTSELSGIQLDWAVAKCEGYFSTNGQVPEYWESPEGVTHFLKMRNADWHPVHWTLASIDWAEMGSIIEQNMISIAPALHEGWEASPWPIDPNALAWGDTPLEAAARCYVASKLGDVVDIPEELV
jgi:hypothetical protein